MEYLTSFISYNLLPIILNMSLTGALVILFVLAVGQLACVIFTRGNCAIHDLMAGTIVVDYASQTIFKTTEDLIAYQKRMAAERAARAPY